MHLRLPGTYGRLFSLYAWSDQANCLSNIETRDTSIVSQIVDMDAARRQAFNGSDVNIPLSSHQTVQCILAVIVARLCECFESFFRSAPQDEANYFTVPTEWQRNVEHSILNCQHFGSLRLCESTVERRPHSPLSMQDAMQFVPRCPDDLFGRHPVEAC